MFPAHNFANQLGVSVETAEPMSNQEPSHSAFGDPGSWANSQGDQANLQGHGMGAMPGMPGMPGMGAIPMGETGSPDFSQDQAKTQLQGMIQMIQSGQAHGHSHGGEGPGDNMMVSMQQRLSKLNPEQMEKFQARMVQVMQQNHTMMAAQGLEPEEMTGSMLQGGHGHAHGEPGGCDEGHGHSHGGQGQAHGGHGHSHGGQDHPHGDDLDHEPPEGIAGDIVAPSVTKGYMYHDPLAAKLPRDSLFNIGGGGHYQPPEFGWGALAPKNTDAEAKSIIPSPLEGHHMQPNTLFVNMDTEKDTGNRIIVKNLPVFGRVRFIIEKQGIYQWLFILFYWIYGNFATWNVILLPQRADGRMPMVLILWYALISVLCIVSFLRASTLNPGRASPEFEKKYGDSDWTFCNKCNHRRPPKAHHCRRCGQCVLKMDHHCPWINNCVGEENQYSFMQLVFYAYLLSLTSLVLCGLYYWHMKPCEACDKTSFAIVHQQGFVVALTIISVLMTLGGGGLVLTQHINVAMNTTTIEWMKMQAEMASTGKWPSWSQMPKQQKSMAGAYRDLCGQGSFLFWLCPFGRRRPQPKSSSHTV